MLLYSNVIIESYTMRVDNIIQLQVDYMMYAVFVNTLLFLL